MSAANQPLWRDRDFRNFWQADTASLIGTNIGALALPLTAALVLDAGPWEIGLLAAAGQLPALLFGLIAGAWIDRRRRRPIMIVADLARAGLLLLIPLAYLLDVLSMPLLYAVAFGTGIFTILFDLAFLAFVPLLSGRDRLIEANSKIEATASLAQVVGPGIAGVLVAVLTAPITILLDAVSFLLSAFWLGKIEKEEPEPTAAIDRPPMRAEIRAGLRVVTNDPILRPLLATTGVTNLFGFIFMAVYTLFMIENLGLSSNQIGAVFAVGGVGALIGSLLAQPLSIRIRTGTLLIGSQMAFGLSGLLVPVAVLVDQYALPLVIAAEFLQWLALVIYFVNAVSLRQMRAEPAMLGRVNSAFVFVSRGVQPIGSLLGGAMGGLIGLPLTLVIGEIGMLLAAGVLLMSPLRHGTIAPPVGSERLVTRSDHSGGPAYDQDDPDISHPT